MAEPICSICGKLHGDGISTVKRVIHLIDNPKLSPALREQIQVAEARETSPFGPEDFGGSDYDAKRPTDNLNAFYAKMAEACDRKVESLQAKNQFLSFPSDSVPAHRPHELLGEEVKLNSEGWVRALGEGAYVYDNPVYKSAYPEELTAEHFNQEAKVSRENPFGYHVHLDGSVTLHWAVFTKLLSADQARILATQIFEAQQLTLRDLQAATEPPGPLTEPPGPLIEEPDK